MAHVNDLEFHPHHIDGGYFSYKEVKESPTHSEPDDTTHYVSRASISRWTSDLSETHAEHPEQGGRQSIWIFFKDGGTAKTFHFTEQQFDEFLSWQYPPMADDPNVALPLQLVEDEVRYVKPGIGTSEKGEHFFRFRNPNGKAAISINFADVDIRKFVSNNDDTHDFVVITKGRVQVKCQCTVAEQLGLEYRINGLTKFQSAADANADREVAESVARDAAAS